MDIELKPVGKVRSSRKSLTDDFWGGARSIIELDDSVFDASSLAGLDQFSHIEVIYHFHLAAPDRIVLGAEHPRENPAWPRVGIFAQRKKNRPNRLGLSACRLIKVEGLSLTVEELDAVDGTPVLDVKPYVLQFAPRAGSVRQPAWMDELMKDYFASK